MSKLNKEETNKILEIMKEEYKDAKCALDYDSEFHLLVAVMLSAQTTDIAVNKITPELFKLIPNPKALKEMPKEQLEEIIKSIGLYKNKAKNLIAMAKKLDEEFDGLIPSDFEKLTSLPGVGRKTANVVLAECFKLPSIAVDTHVFRLSNRIGLTDEKDVLKTELGLQKALPKDSWIQMHHALIWHGRKICTARNPNCENCCISEICKRNGI